MNSGLYAACSGLVARMQALDTIASNVANSSSNGFRGEKDTFHSVLAQAASHSAASNLNKATNTYSQLGNTRLDETQGVLTRTDNDTDVALEGPGYFKVATANGVAYTRDGNFQTDRNGHLVTSRGEPVLGDSGPIIVGSGKLTISADGTISSGGAITGKLAVVTFAPGTNLTHRGDSLYAAPAGATEQPSTATVQQGSLESSNVSPVEGVVQLVSAQRAAESMRHVLTMIDGEMNKTAVQDLSRVA